MFHVNDEPKGKFLRTETISCIVFTNSIIGSPEVGVQLPGLWVTLHLYVSQHVQMRGNGCTRYVSPIIGYASGF